MDRYKFKNSKFSSASDAKKLRTIQAQSNRKLQRSNTFFQNRVILTPSARNDQLAAPRTSTKKGQFITEERKTKKYTAKEIHELSNLRYQKMLLFKEEKKRVKDMDRKRKQPVFHTGVYQNDAPTFLGAKKEAPDNSRLEMAGCTPLISKKSLKFSINPTPSQKNIRASVKPTPHQKEYLGAKNTNVSAGVTRSSTRAELALAANKSTTTKVNPKSHKSKTTAILAAKNNNITPAINLGNGPKKSAQRRLPTPGVRSSFAPGSFKFAGVSGMKPIDFNRAGDKKTPKKRATSDNKENEPVSKNAHEAGMNNNFVQSVEAPTAKPQTRVSFHTQMPNIGGEQLKKGHFSSLRRRRMSKQATPLERSFHDVKIDLPVPLTFSEDSIVDELVEGGNETLSDAEAQLMSLLEPSNTEQKAGSVSSSDLCEVESPIETLSSVIGKRDTLKKSIIKKEKNKKVNLSVSFVTEKVAESKIIHKGTPIPRRSSRLVRLSLLPGLFDDDGSTDTCELVSGTSQDLISFDTPKSSTRNKKLPKSDGESTKKGRLSSLQRRRASKLATPLEKMFSEVQMDSPIPLVYSDADGEDSYNGGDETLSDAEIKIMALLEPSNNNLKSSTSPVGNVWSPDASDDDSAKKMEYDAGSVTTSPNTINMKKKNKASLSVSFATNEDSRQKLLHKGTPLPRRRSSRIARISLLPGLFDKNDGSPAKPQRNSSGSSEDLIDFDTPKSAPTRKRISKTARLSLLPHFTVDD